ncbi:MAG: DUF1963 domain-containing protein [Hyphomicrobiales bacterium]|nr:DUF1963 domain-containing protein [Hyphomicrobiales bacterium]
MSMLTIVAIIVFILIPVFFGFKKWREHRRAIQKFSKEFVEFHVDTENMKDSARASARPAVMLKPQIPIGDNSSTGWFGGRPALPEGMAVPEKDGEKLVFVGQINLSEIPKGIWSGLGPRSGWLAFFLPEKWPPKPTVLHFDGPLVEVSASDAHNAEWTRIHDFKEPREYLLPRWPIIVETLQGSELHDVPTSHVTKRDCSGTLLDTAYYPFDIETKSLLLRCLSECVVNATKSTIRFPPMRKLRPEDAAWFERQRLTMLDTFEHFFELEGIMHADRQVSEEHISEYIKQLENLSICDYQYLRNDDDGYCELNLHEGKLLDKQPDWSQLGRWWQRYSDGLANHARKEYTSYANALPTKLCNRLENVWQDETPLGLGIMGHAPQGHIYTPHGPDSPNEVLLELHTSRLAGWIWGDCYSVVFLIKRSDLQKGRFSSVMFDITN